MEILSIRQAEKPKAEDETAATETDKPAESAVVTIQGPLSVLCTDILNKVLASETMMGMLTTSTLVKGDKAKYNGSDDLKVAAAEEVLQGLSEDNQFGRVLNVFCFDRLHMDEIFKVSEHMTKSQSEKTILAVESIDGCEGFLRSITKMRSEFPNLTVVYGKENLEDRLSLFLKNLAHAD